MRYDELKEKNIPADAERRFGKELFGDFRGLDELDTDYEERIFYAIEEFVGRNVRDRNLLRALNILHQYKDVYPEVLKPDVNTVYRGTAVSYSQIKKNIDNGNLKDAGDYYSFPYTYKSIKRAQSWTTDVDVAIDFAITRNYGRADKLSTDRLTSDDPAQIKKMLTTKSIPAILETTVNDDFLFKPEFLSRLRKYTVVLSSKPDENEVLYIGNEPLQCTMYVEKEIINMINDVFNERNALEK